MNNQIKKIQNYIESKIILLNNLNSNFQKIIINGASL